MVDKSKRRGGVFPAPVASEITGAEPSETLEKEAPSDPALIEPLESEAPADPVLVAALEEERYRLTSRYAFYHDDGSFNAWDEGTIVTDKSEIEMLAARKAPIERA